MTGASVVAKWHKPLRPGTRTRVLPKPAFWRTRLPDQIPAISQKWNALARAVARRGSLHTGTGTSPKSAGRKSPTGNGRAGLELRFVATQCVAAATRARAGFDALAFVDRAIGGQRPRVAAGLAFDSPCLRRRHVTPVLGVAGECGLLSRASSGQLEPTRRRRQNWRRLFAASGKPLKPRPIQSFQPPTVTPFSRYSTR